MEDKANLKEYMLKEIDIVQDIIKRMAFNSFMIKGWAITLVVVTLLLKGTKLQVLIAFIPLLVFWFLDAYFLQLERKYRKLYEWVIEHRLATDKYLFDMNINDKERFANPKYKVHSRFHVMFSITLGWFYGSIAILTVIYTVILFLFQKGGN
ncbi:MAG: hypothetical protein DDT42_00539 [candidate division WS2 bacterium]|uniref:DUF3278 domain-containing protein n=1 Tax=Psychracetigena formicireducens TaxID=2986056 RepID=A0A9E2BGP6_PSYF1|nr:hypothetical protein [Candidatus Psychracetigena formicireducens]MBT9144694.1 hypothetical protein [Candidatus Psychracetigena formicireducens]